MIELGFLLIGAWILDSALLAIIQGYSLDNWREVLVFLPIIPVAWAIRKVSKWLHN